MRLFLVLAALSALAAAGPIPPFSNGALEARAAPSTPANMTLDFDPAAALAQLKAIYASLHEPNSTTTLIVKRGFWDWVEDIFHAPGLKIRSSVSASTPANTLIVKRGFWDWVEDIFHAPGLKIRSSVSASTPADNNNDNSSGSDPVATLAQLKAVYDSLNEKRTEEGGLEAKRNFAQWLQNTPVAPGLKTRSSVSASASGDQTLGPDPAAALTQLKAVYDSQNAKRTAGRFEDFWDRVEVNGLPVLAD